MEITFVWSWLSFWIGIASAVVGIFVVLLLIAFGQYKKQQKNKKMAEDVFGKAASDFLKS
jgi:phosphotransferase system  glucose/maltose/N-acetylglucosamine-specific IIC component